MKIFLLIIRILMGALFLFSSVTFLFKLIVPPEMTGAMKVFNDGLNASVYLMPTVKVVELICGLALLSNRFVPLALVLISPIIVNIFFVHIFLAPEGLPVAIFLIIANSLLAYQYKEIYSPLFKSKVD
ncbi:MAG TPA: DoxX family membrane protein [Leptospiraceae bacterium]|nr:DoxX family membrane protein [Leptospiraceae bacterium]HMW04928.1 DoxX family membrane protein [Leptospiraceae bacterium]HMX31923.1 DoxX family membrane protein [Leptospiraceae bacterium]HMY30851.1 DoxX family membrane protein [Leptospiraceae bacterium]HMZ62655.1 DoxX family membrane protein [Leptospiraceae bacterium]